MPYFKDFYLPLCKDALNKFCNEHWPCEFRTKKGRQCLNAKATHQKGHQDDNGKIEAGDYETSFTAERFGKRWAELLEAGVKSHQTTFEAIQHVEQHRRDPGTDTQIAVALHQRYTGKFYASRKDCYNNATCLSCLMFVPEHAIGCGHVMCSICVKNYTKNASDLQVILKWCPIHQDPDLDWRVYQKPSFAGVRVLCLDG